VLLTVITLHLTLDDLWCKLRCYLHRLLLMAIWTWHRFTYCS